MKNYIHESISIIINALKNLGLSAATIKNYTCTLNQFEKYQNDFSHSERIEKEMFDFHTVVKSNRMNRYIRPLYLLYRYLDTGEIDFKIRRYKEKLQCPKCFLSIYSAYEQHCMSKDYSLATIHCNLFQSLRFLIFLHDSGLDLIEQMNFRNIEMFIHTYDQYSIKYIGTMMYTLKKFNHFLFKSKFVSLDYSTMITGIRVPRNGSIPHAWKKEEVIKLLSAVDREDPAGKRDYALLLMIVKLGLRVSDIRNLQLSDINWTRKTINIIMQKTQQPLELPLLEDIGWAIIDYLKNGRPQTTSNRLFVRHKAPFTAFGNIANFGKMLIRYMRKANLDTDIKTHHGLHSLRNALAKNMLDAGVSLPVISQTLGHQNLNTTSIYLKIDIEGLRKCALDPEEVFH